MERGRLSGRGYHRIRRVARTIADLGPDPVREIDEGDRGARTRVAHRRPSDRRVEGSRMMSLVERAHLAALAGFDHMTTPRLVALCSGRSPVEAYAMATGAAPPSPPIAGAFRAVSRPRGSMDGLGARDHATSVVAERCADLGVEILVPGDPGWPAQLLDDPRRPAVLFAQGDPGVLRNRRVGIVGTRNPTRRWCPDRSAFRRRARGSRRLCRVRSRVGCRWRGPPRCARCRSGSSGRGRRERAR